MDWYSSVFEMIDMRSFSNLWYWIALAVLWSTASHRVVGVPFDMVQRAARDGGQADRDLAELVRINLDRLFFVLGSSGPWAVAIATAILTMLFVTGFVYRFEFAQATFFLAFPMVVVGLLNVRTGARIRREGATGERLRTLMKRHRTIIQGIGIVSIFVTTTYGLFQTMLVQGPL